MAIVSVTWQPPAEDADPEAYVLQWATDSAFTAPHGQQYATASAAVDNLATSTLYYFRVAAIYRSIQSGWSAAASITTTADTTAPDPPSSIAWTWNANGDLEVTWSNPTSPNLKDVEVKIWSGADKAIFYRALFSAGGRVVWTAGMNSADTGGLFDASVYIELRAQSWGSVFASAVVPASQPFKARPSAPTGLTSSWASDAGNAAADVSITWASQADANSYRLTIGSVTRQLFNPYFLYTFTQNQIEHTGLAIPSLALSLVAVDGLGQTSAAAATATIANAKPPATTATIIGGFSVLAITIVRSTAADLKEYTLRIVKDGTTVYTTRETSLNSMLDISPYGSGSYQLGIVANDLFNQASTESLSAAVTLEPLTIADLRADATYTDSAGRSGTALDALKDTNTASGGVTYT